MSHPRSNVDFEELFAIDAAVGLLLSVAKGERHVEAPSEQIAAVATTHHVIINPSEPQNVWFKERLASLSDDESCEHLRTGLQQRLETAPIRDNSKNYTTSVEQLADLLRGHMAAERHGEPFGAPVAEITQIKLLKVTCFKDGDCRRFVAHFDVERISL